MYKEATQATQKKGLLPVAGVGEAGRRAGGWVSRGGMHGGACLPALCPDGHSTGECEPRQVACLPAPCCLTPPAKSGGGGKTGKPSGGWPAQRALSSSSFINAGRHHLADVPKTAPLALSTAGGRTKPACSATAELIWPAGLGCWLGGPGPTRHDTADMDAAMRACEAPSAHSLPTLLLMA